MKLHPIDTMPIGVSVLVGMILIKGIMKELYNRDTYYYVCTKDEWGHIVEDNGEGYAEFHDDDNIKLLGWVSLDELDEIFNVKEK